MQEIVKQKALLFIVIFLLGLVTGGYLKADFDQALHKYMFTKIYLEAQEQARASLYACEKRLEQYMVEIDLARRK